jgi:hypothetical protein
MAQVELQVKVLLAVVVEMQVLVAMVANGQVLQELQAGMEMKELKEMVL